MPDMEMPTAEPIEERAYYIERHGLRFAGTHLLLDLWGASRLDDLAAIDAALREAVEACGATLIDIKLHHFTPNGGVTGVVVLSESHISVHSWPERGYAAFDVFVCGAADPYKAIPVLKRVFKPERLLVTENMRGIEVL